MLLFALFLSCNHLFVKASLAFFLHIILTIMHHINHYLDYHQSYKKYPEPDSLKGGGGYTCITCNIMCAPDNMQADGRMTYNLILLKYVYAHRQLASDSYLVGSNNYLY